ncbi:Transcriptional activator NphR [Trichinella spiralis]|uniref:Transcriptional activator NphR n=1 Tax=Trichinella spiralis TaxID=6334 RepID=A0ABR3KWW5_TRISP
MKWNFYFIAPQISTANCNEFLLFRCLLLQILQINAWQFILHSNPSSEIIRTNLAHLLRLKRRELPAWEGCMFWSSRTDRTDLKMVQI